MIPTLRTFVLLCMFLVSQGLRKDQPDLARLRELLNDKIAALRDSITAERPKGPKVTTQR